MTVDSRATAPSRIAAALIVVSGGFLAAVAGMADAQSFTRTEAGIHDDGGISAGVSLGDYDGDGHLDLFVANWKDQLDFLYHNNGDGSFSRVVDSPVATEHGFSSGGCWGDFDGDGDLDLFVARQRNEHNSLYRNDGNGAFVKLTEGDIVNDFGDSYAGAWADVDNDGNLDLFVANSGQPNFLYRNNGDGSFTRITDGDIVRDVAVNWSAVWGDYDHDGFPDLFVPSAAGQNNLLYHNNGDGSFTRITDGDIGNDGGSSYGASWGDLDNDGDLDLFVANFVKGEGVQNGLYVNNGDGSFTKVVSGDIVDDGASPFGASWADLDNDGDLDLFEAIWGGPGHLYRNNGDGSFARITEGPAVSLAGFPSGHAAADFDNDGSIDLVLANWDNLNNFIFRNAPTANNWLSIQLRGVRSNRFGIGARLTATAVINGREVAQTREMKTTDALRSQGGNRVHFGLGDAASIRSLKVEWPSGKVDLLSDLEANALVTIDEERGVVGRVAASPSEGAREGVAELLYQTVREQGVEHAIEQYRSLKLTAGDRYDLGEAQLNALGYSLLRDGNGDAARAIFMLNLREHPGSANCYDSLAEAYATTGDGTRALDTYRALLEMVADDPSIDQQQRETYERTAGYYMKHFGGTPKP